MVVCKFFLEGCCRYGSRCRFEHKNYYDYNSSSSYDYNNSYTSPLIGSGSIESRSVNNAGRKFNNNVHETNVNEDIQSQANKNNLNDIVQIVSKDILQLEKGNQWLLTSYSPIKECGNLPGWDDHSPEEVRWESYNASNKGTFSNCKQAIENLYKNAQERRTEIKNRPKAIHIIDNQIRNGPTESPEVGNFYPTEQSNFSVFGNIQSNSNHNTLNVGTSESPFSNTQVNLAMDSSVFGLAPTDSSTFVTQSSVFGSTELPLGSLTSPVSNVFNTQSNTALQTSFSFVLDNKVKTSEQNFTQNKFLNNLQSKNTDSKHLDESLIYSDINKLTPAELSAFESQTFNFGYIPLKPPPKILCGI